MELERRFIEADQGPEGQGYESYPRSASGLELGNIWNILRRSTRTLGAIALSAATLVGIYSLFLPRSYTATGIIILDARQPKVFSIDGVLAREDSNQDNIDTQLEWLRSPRIAASVLDLLKSRNIGWPKSVDQESSGQPESAVPGLSTAYSPRQIKAFQGPLKVERKGRSLLVDVMYSDSDPVRAAATANAIMDGYIADQVQAKSSATQANGRLLKNRVDALRLELVQAEKQIQDYKVEKDIIEIGDLTLAQKEVANYEEELTKARSISAEAEARHSQVQSMANELVRDSAQKRVKILESGLSTLKQKMQQSSEETLKLNELRRDATALKTTYISLLNRLREVQAQETAVAADAQIVSYAMTPQEPSFPKRKVMIFVTLLVSLILGAIGIVLRELIRGRIHSGADVERGFGLQPAAVIPLVTGLRLHADSNSGIFSLPGDPQGKFQQAIFALRRWVEGGAPSRNVVVAVVSQHAGDGRSTVAAALAASAARSGKKTLLMDCDLRDNALTQAFASNGTGEDGIVRGGEHAADFSTAGNADGSPPLDILGSPSFSAFIDKSRRAYGLTVIDTAAMGDYIDARAVTDLADAVVVVLASGKTTRTVADGILQQLAAGEAKPTALILNKVPLKIPGLWSLFSEDLPNMLPNALNRIQHNMTNARSIIERLNMRHPS